MKNPFYYTSDLNLSKLLSANVRSMKNGLTLSPGRYLGFGLMLLVVVNYLYVGRALAAAGPISTIPLNSTQESVESQLVAPKKQTSRDGMTINWYNSVSATTADLLYFRDGILVFKSLYIRREPRTLKSYTDLLGNPDRTIFKNASDHDDRVERVHVWAQKGTAVISLGEQFDSQVEREMTFVPLTVDEYMATWGASYKDNQIATISAVLTSSGTPTPMPVQQEPIPIKNHIVPIGGLLIFSGMLTYIFMRILLRRKQSTPIQ